MDQTKTQKLVFTKFIFLSFITGTALEMQIWIFKTFLTYKTGNIIAAKHKKVYIIGTYFVCDAV